MCAPDCDDEDTCESDDDCASHWCDPSTMTCGTPSCDDGVKNGDETDIDCGGACGPTCDEGEGCASEDDCESGDCSQWHHTCKAKCDHHWYECDDDCDCDHNWNYGCNSP